MTFIINLSPCMYPSVEVPQSMHRMPWDLVLDVFFYIFFNLLTVINSLFFRCYPPYLRLASFFLHPHYFSVLLPLFNLLHPSSSSFHLLLPLFFFLLPPLFFLLLLAYMLLHYYYHYSTSILYPFCFLCRGMLEQVDAEAAATAGPVHLPAQRHIPHLRLPAGPRGILLPQRRNMLHRQDRRELDTLLRVSISYSIIEIYITADLYMNIYICRDIDDVSMI